MVKVELTDTEAFLISEVFERTAYENDDTSKAVREVAEDCGVLKQVGSDNLDELFESIWEKTKC